MGAGKQPTGELILLVIIPVEALSPLQSENCHLHNLPSREVSPEHHLQAEEYSGKYRKSMGGGCRGL